MTNNSDTAEFADEIRRLHGPILILGGSGFVGANLFRTLLAHRSDVFATTSRLPAWRLVTYLPEMLSRWTC